MSVETPETPEPNWTDTTSCPFCGEHLSDPGAGFIDHVSESPECERGFEAWRTNVGGDMRGGWSG